ncbi:MAG: coiled-coil domain-containing protein, partial [Lachnospiraceae bacterium]
MKKLGTRVLTAVLASSMIVMPLSAAPSVDELKKNKEEAQGEVDSLQQQLVEIIEKINELETDLISTGEEIETVTVDLKETEELEKQQYEDMKLRIKYMYEEGD